MELIVLGAGGTWPAPGGATSGFIVQEGGFHLWMDAGTGTLSRLQQHLPLAEIDAVMITHGHPDHFLDLYPTYYARYYGDQGQPHLPVYAPDDFFDRFIHLVSEESQHTVLEAFDHKEMEPNAPFEVGPFEVEAFEMTHVGVRSFGYRIRSGDAVLAYTGDTGPSEEVVKLAAGADLFVSEATWQDGQELLPFHLSARQAGEHAGRAGVGLLVLTHIWPSHDPAVSLREAGETYDGPIELAAEGMRTTVGA